MGEKGKLMKHIAAFENYLLYERHLTNSSVVQYLSKLHEFNRFLKNDTSRPQDFNSVNKATVLEFLSYLQKVKKNNSATLSNYIVVLRTYYKWAIYVTKGSIFSPDKKENLNTLLHYLLNIVKVKRQHNVPFVPTLEDVTRLRDVMKAYLQLNSFDKARPTYRKILMAYTMMELFITTGMRSNELRSLQLKDVDIPNKVLFIAKGKGGYQRHSIFGESAVELLKEYIEVFNFQPNDFLFPIKRANYINPIIKRWASRARISPKLHTHSFRHFFITESENRGVPLQIIAQQVGHQSLNSTKHYTHLNIQKVKERYGSVEI